MEQVIDHKVPVAKFSDLAAYDGSVTVRRTDGELSAKCDKEGANFLAINLAHDVLTGKKTVAQARDFYANAIKEFALQNKMSPYMKSFQFSMSKGATNETDKHGVSEELNKTSIGVARRVAEIGFPGFIETVPAYSSATVFYDPAAVRRNFPDTPTAFDAVQLVS